MQIHSFLKLRFKYLHSAREKWLYIIGATVFAHIFLVVFQPYGIYEEMRNPINPVFHKFLFFLSITVSSFAALSLSQLVLRPLLKFQEVSIKKYALWFCIETFIITFISFLFSLVIPDLGNDFELELNIGFQVTNYFRAFIILLFPFFGVIVYEFIQKLNGEIKELSVQLSHYQQAFEKAHPEELLIVKDENENVSLELYLKNFLMAEAGNQYIIVYYLEKGKIKKEIIRNRLKNFLLACTDSSIYQCHRSYAVNLINVSHLDKNQGKNFLAFYQDEYLRAPVSKSYLEQIKKVL